MSETEKPETTSRGGAVTAPEPLVERLAGAAWDGFKGSPFIDITPRDAESIARTLLPVVEQEIAAARAEALREAAKEAEERGDIGKDGGCEAWTWLRIRADRIGGAE